MNNTIEIRTDGLNVYAVLEIKANTIGKVIVIVMLLFAITALILILSTIKVEDIGSFLIPIFLLVLLIIYFPLRFLIWNMFGKEILLITTKSISYQYDYGIIKTNLKTISYNRLGTGFEKTKDHNGLMKGYLAFYNYDSQTNIPELIHQTTVLIELEKIEQLDSEISKIFMTEFNNNRGFIGHSAN